VLDEQEDITTLKKNTKSKEVESSSKSFPCSLGSMRPSLTFDEEKKKEEGFNE